MPGITISSAYGAGGSVVAPKVAERLGVAMLDRAISARVADDLQVSLDEAQHGERKQSFADRFFCALAPLADTVAGDAEIARSDQAGATEFRTDANKIMSDALDKGAVILGRGGAAAFQDRDDVLHIRFYGTPEQRLDAAMRFSGVSEDEARGHMERTDAARAKYVHHLYGRDINDPSLYHLQFNTPLLEQGQCIEMIVDAYQAFLAKKGERVAAG
ncbi:AAA family ATPase [Flexivirga meconopsidis]|uniref:cytidylate kinase-like family protein n=1 Tax=Flexivirga meconopsidis TaxID=2977121 RepID=UPI00223F9A26|nr:cytidylate kinase-like family protein [Flexivirga meconopsidis]